TAGLVQRAGDISRGRRDPWRLGLLLLQLGAEALLLVAHLGRKGVAEVLRLGDLTDLYLAVLVHRVGAALDPLHRLVHVLALQEPEPRDELLGLAEWPVDDGAVGAAEADALALGAGKEAFAGQEDAGPGQLLVVLSQLLEQLLAGHHAGFAVRGRLHNRHEPHVWFLLR